MINITVVGAGVQGTRMAEKYSKFSTARVRAVISAHKPKGGPLANVPFFTSAKAWEKAFGRPDVDDVFDLCVHQDILLRVLIECIRIGGKNFILPKPIALTQKELDHIDELITRYKLKIVVASQWHYAALIARLEEFVRKNKKDISSVEMNGDQDELKTTLGLALVAERVRSQVFTDTLERMNSEELVSLGMSEKLRDLIVPLFSGLSSIDTEFVRFKARALRSEPYSESSIDAVREQQRVVMVLQHFCEGIEVQGAESLFGDSGEDFVLFLRLLIESYRSVSVSGVAFSDVEMRERATLVKQAFVQFIKKHPDHSLMFIPKMFSYVETGEGVDLGFDPEIRVLWQSPEHKKQTEGFMRDSVVFGQSIHRQFPDLIIEEEANIDHYRPIICDDIGSWGVNMVFRAEGFEDTGTSFLIENRIRTALTEPMKEMIESIQGDIKMGEISTEKFQHTVKRFLLSHELGHQFYDDPRFKKELGDVYRPIEEHKAELLAACGFADISKENPQSDVDKQERTVLNLVILSNALLCAALSPDGELAAYYHSAIGILNSVSEQGVFVESDDGNVNVDFEKINGDFAKMVGERARDVLNIYRNLDKNLQDSSQAQNAAELLMTEQPFPIVAKWIHQFREKIILKK